MDRKLKDIRTLMSKGFMPGQISESQGRILIGKIDRVLFTPSMSRAITLESLKCHGMRIEMSGKYRIS